MIRGLWFFVQLTLLVLASVWLAEQKGAVSIEWGGWLLETSAGMLAFIVLAAAGILVLLWRLWRLIKGTPHAIGRFRLHRRRNAGYAALVRSLSAIAAGEGAEALRLATRSEEIGEPVLAHLAAAEAAEMAGDIPRAEAEYKRLRDRPDTALIGLRGLIALAERRDDLAHALELAVQARKLAPKSPWAATRLYEFEARMGRFADAERTLADATKLGAYTTGEGDRLLARLLLRKGLDAEAAGREADALSDAERSQTLDLSLSGAAVLGARILARSGRIPAAERMLSESWKVAPDPALSRAWLALSPKGDINARLRQAERLYALDRDSVEGRLCLAETELATARWGEARKHLVLMPDMEKDGAISRRHSRLMAFLESAAGNEAAAQSWFEKSLAVEDRKPQEALAL
jgi:HemY protein